MHLKFAALLAFAIVSLVGCAANHAPQPSAESSSKAPATQGGDTSAGGAVQAPKPDRDPKRFAAEIEAFEKYDRKNTPPKDAVLFVGSSSIVGWPTAASFPELTVINRGFGGSTLPDVNYYVDKVVTPYHARAIVLYAGDNDVFEGDPPEQIAANFATFVDKTRKIQPNTPIVFLSIKPSPSRMAVWPRAQSANILIEAECRRRGPSVRYVDVATPMLNGEAEPRPDLFLEDMLHMKPVGYELWTNVLSPVLEELLK